MALICVDWMNEWIFNTSFHLCVMCIPYLCYSPFNVASYVIYSFIIITLFIWVAKIYQLVIYRSSQNWWHRKSKLSKSDEWIKTQLCTNVLNIHHKLIYIKLIFKIYLRKVKCESRQWLYQMWNVYGIMDTS